VAIVFFYPDEPSLKKKMDLMIAISGCKHKTLFTNVPYPKSDMQLSTTDLKIIENRQEDMSKSNKKIADELHIAGRTVKRRLTKMIRGGVIWPVASLNVAALKDCIYCDLVVTYTKQGSRLRTEAQILSLVEDYLVFNGHFESLTEFNMIIPSVPVARKILDRVERLRSVKTARIDFVEERIELYEVVSEKVQRQIALMTMPIKISQ
jgi:DNA-binding Lrp family transcriptional regulator